MGSLASNIIYNIRKKTVESLLQLMQPSHDMLVLDVGVGSDRKTEANIFEKAYPWPDRIVAVGLENASFLEKEYKGLRYIFCNGLNLPFKNKAFDLVVSIAVIEHIGSRQRQKDFVHELVRVGKNCCIVAPNRWFPLEVHTLIPLIHWLPFNWFRKILRLAGNNFRNNFLAKEENLNYIPEKVLLSMFPPACQVHTRHTRLFGFILNLFFVARAK